MMKHLLGIKSDDKDILCQFVLDKVTDMICNYCNIEKIPKGLNNILLNMAVDVYRAEKLGKEQSEGVIKSISEGDVSLSFGSSSSISENPQMSFIKNYTEQLDRYRKARW